MGITWSLRKIKSRLAAEKVHQNATEQKKHLANRTRNDYSINYENLRRRPAHRLYGQIQKNNIIETVQMCHFKHRRLNFRQPEKEAFLCPHFSHHVFQQL